MEWLSILAVFVLAGSGILALQLVSKGSRSAASSGGPAPEAAQPAPRPLTPTRILQWEGDGDFETQVEGESVYQDALLSIVGEKTEESQEFETRAFLSPEVFNGNTLYAVLIEGKKVGYLEVPMTAVLNSVVERNNLGVVAFEVDAMITGGWKRPGSEGMFGVILDLVDDYADEDD